MPFPNLQYSVSNRIAAIILDRPDKRNALNPALVQSLQDALTLAQEDAQVKIILLKANGKVFSAGADLEHLQQLQKNSFEENLADSQQLMNLYRQIYFHEKIIIAQVEGHAIAGGCGLATVCDFCYSVPEAKFGYTEVQIGFVPALVSVFLLRKIGETHAKELLLGGELITASRAAEIGLINGIIKADEIDKFVNDKALQLITSASSNSLKLTKKLIATVQDLSLEQALSFAASLNAEARSSLDCKKGIEAFLQKKKISW